MFIGRLSTRHSDFSDYIISLKPLTKIQYSVYSEPPYIYEDFEVRGDCVILRKYDVESNLGIKLNGLETKEI